MNCPKCGYKLTHLTNYCKTEQKYNVELEKGKIKFTYIDTLDTYDTGEYECPNCGTTLTCIEEEVMAILKDKITSEMGKRFAEIALGGGNLDD